MLTELLKQLSELAPDRCRIDGEFIHRYLINAGGKWHLLGYVSEIESIDGTALLWLEAALREACKSEGWIPELVFDDLAVCRLRSSGFGRPLLAYETDPVPAIAFLLAYLKAKTSK